MSEELTESDLAEKEKFCKQFVLVQNLQRELHKQMRILAFLREDNPAYIKISGCAINDKDLRISMTVIKPPKWFNLLPV